MKNYKITVTALIALLAPLTTLAAIASNLKVGMSGTSVYELQDVLQEQGCLAHQSTGYFGLLTLNAVKCFQTENNIPSTGYVGVLTRTAINAILDVSMNESNQAEIAETGTTTPVASPVPVAPETVSAVPQTIQAPIAPTVTISVGICTLGINPNQSGDGVELPKIGFTDVPITIVGQYSSGSVTWSSKGTPDVTQGRVLSPNNAPSGFGSNMIPHLSPDTYVYTIKLKDFSGNEFAPIIGEVTTQDCQ